MVAARNVQRRAVRAGGIETSYLEAGPASAEAVVLLHDGAIGSDAESCWSGFLGKLSGRYRVLAPDLIGHGATRKIVAFDRDPMTQRIDHVRDFCDALLLDMPLLVGSSFGGGMILRGAASGTLRMRAGVSIGGTGGLHMHAEKFAVLQRYQPTEQWARTVCELMARRDLPRRTADRLARSKLPGHVESLAAARVLRPVEPVDAPDWRPAFLKALHRIEVPMLLVAGADDVLFEAGWADRLAERIPRGRAVTLAGTRHQPHIDEPTAVANLVLDFIEGVLR